MTPSDQAVLKRWMTQRDAEAFRAIVQRHGAVVYAVCRRILRNDAEAEEVTQECFETLARCERREPPRELGSWLHGMASKKCLMHLRSEGRRRRREVEYAASQERKQTPEWDDIYGYVDEAINELPEDTREAIVAHFLYGQSHGEIARATGIPRRTVSNRVKKGVELIGDSLRKRGVVVPAIGLAALLTAKLSEAAALPIPVLNALGKLALAHSTGAKAAGASSTAAALHTAVGLLVTKNVVLAGAAGLLVCFGLWKALHRPEAGEAPVARAAAAVEEGDKAQAEDGFSKAGEGLSVAPVDEGPSATEGVGGPDTEAKGGVITGLVSVAATGEPVPGVKVTLEVEDTGLVFTAFTNDPDGEYVFKELPGGDYWITCYPRSELVSDREGFTCARSSAIGYCPPDGRERVDFALRPGTRVSGRVTDTRGIAVEGAEVSISGWNKAYTDADGLYFHPGVAQEGSRRDFVVWVRADGYGGLTLANIHIPKEGLSNLDFVLDEGAMISGNVVDAKGTRLPGVEVRANYAGPPPPMIYLPEPVWTDEEGCFVLRCLHPCEYGLIVSSGKRVRGDRSGWDREEAGPFEVAAGQSLENVEVVVSNVGSIEGRVSDEEGRPVKDVLVEASLDGGPVQAWAFTDEGGKYRLEGIATDRVALEFTPEGYKVHGSSPYGCVSVAEAAVDGGDVDVVLPKEGAIHGVVKNNGGEVLDGVQVKVAGFVFENGRYSRWMQTRGEVRREGLSRGEFVIDGVAPGTVKLEVSAPGYAMEEVTDVVVGSGQTTDIEVFLNRPGTLEGEVEMKSEKVKMQDEEGEEI